MLESALEFASHLRAAGARVSTAEVIDAARALAELGIEERSAVRAALRATLVKRNTDLRIFDQLFELYFSAGSTAGAMPEWLNDVLADAPELVDFVAERLRQEAATLGPLERMILGLTGAELAALIRSSGGLEALKGMASPLQVGFYSYRLQQQLGFDSAIQRARHVIGGLGLDEDVESRILAESSRRAAELREQVRGFVEEQFQIHNLRYREQLASGSLAHKPLATLSPHETRQLRSEVERLARILRTKLRRRPRRKGMHLDVRRILRKALATDGVPMQLRWIERRVHRPRLVVLCDVSDSVRHVSDFMLHFVYTLVDCFDRVDAFAFVAELGPMTELFRDNDIDRAIELVHQGAAVNVFANSNYGRALEQFKSRYLGKVTSRTTVLIIGDGRTNYHPPRASVLADIRRRASRLLWLSPEGPSAWGFGDSAMTEYQPHCDQVVHAYDLDSLRQLVDELVLG